MRPITLTMQAFCSYGAKTTIDFTKTSQNLFLITGDTGAGKSTIFDAIVFALYGEASSGENRKNGKELQSQFVDYGVEPFVELAFMEETDGADRLYTVRRVPRHLRPLKRGAGTKDEVEKVTLTLPDGREFSQNKDDTDRKLEEIVGLTKSQFMQVAMIAQGEFMELLRAKSDKKKEIFRKLFHTEVFQEVVDELFRRRREKLAEIGKIRTVCQTEVSHAVLPETEEQLAELKRSILNAESLNAAEMEQFLTGLDALCTRLTGELEQAEAVLNAAGEKRDSSRTAVTQARQLLTAFSQLEQARQDLASCAAQEGDMQETARLMAAIRDAREVQTVHQRLRDALEAVRITKTNLQSNTDALPGLTTACEQAEQAEQAARGVLDQETEAFTRVSERVTRALELLEKLDAARKTLADCEAALKTAEGGAEQAKCSLDAFAEQERLWRQEAETLSDAETALALWKVRQSDAKTLTGELDHVRALENGTVQQAAAVETAQAAYTMAKTAYSAENTLYIAKQTAFWDNQAGVLAAEKLHPGQPCPVCGSLDHPHPCTLSADQGTVTREELEALRASVEELQEEQARCAGKAGTAVRLLTERQEHLAAALAQLREKLADRLDDLPAQLTIADADARLKAWSAQLEQEGTPLRENARKLSELKASLSTVEEQKTKLTQVRETAEAQAGEARSALAAAQAEVNSCAARQDYPDRETARAELAAAERKKQTAEAVHSAAAEQARKAKSEKEQAETLVTRYGQELPGQEAEAAARRAAYDAILAEKQVTGEQWQETLAAHGSTDPAQLQAVLTAFEKRRSAAQATEKAALETIGGREQPDLEALEEAREQADLAMKAAQDARDDLGQMVRANRLTYQNLAPQMEERGRIVQEYNRLDGLYSRLSGKVSGARMDIETYVQRYYLRRILDAANDRFRSMSAGTFELRMLDEEQAGQGKNRGLDLMVYSNVTGREREIRTLSGGESFLAALSLALGMADQIQQSCASIHLDIMFIDEGFGSLDDHSRTQAVKTLQHMAGGSKLIGIISHVTELKQQIEDQLLIQKTDHGSTIRWQIS